MGDWYNQAIMPKPHNLDILNYSIGSCPNAEQYAKMSLNLPTFYRLDMGTVKKITRLISKYYEIQSKN